MMIVCTGNFSIVVINAMTKEAYKKAYYSLQLPKDVSFLVDKHGCSGRHGSRDKKLKAHTSEQEVRQDSEHSRPAPVVFFLQQGSTSQMFYNLPKQ